MEENIEIFDDETAREAAYERWRESDDKSGLSTAVLRMSLHGSKQCADGMHRGHIVDLELVRHKNCVCVCVFCVRKKQEKTIWSETFDL